MALDNTAAIVPFAQSQMVSTFIEGIDPFFWNILRTYLLGLFDEYPDLLIDSVPGLGDDEKHDLSAKLREKSRTVLDDFLQKTETYKMQHHVNPIIEAVAVLPKDDLAEMAESLVSLTSFKQRVSLDIETVGGPIDVAVISKGDGFIWIKRKHYFDKELNPHFFALYYHEDER
jgi:hypothetical protein